jgi:hypothetical protein
MGQSESTEEHKHKVGEWLWDIFHNNKYIIMKFS